MLLSHGKILDMSSEQKTLNSPKKVIIVYFLPKPSLFKYYQRNPDNARIKNKFSLVVQ